MGIRSEYGVLFCDGRVRVVGYEWLNAVEICISCIGQAFLLTLS